MSTAPGVIPEGQPETGAVGRMIGVIVSPKKTFGEIARRPTWAAPFITLCVLSIIVGALLGAKTDWRSFFERQDSQNARFEQMSQEQKDTMLENQAKYAPKVAFAFGLIGTVVIIFIVALVYWGAFNLLNAAGLEFHTAFGIASYAFVPSIIGALLAILILLIKPHGDVDPEHFLASSVAAFLPDGSPQWLEKLGQSLELFWIWTLALVAVGFSAANAKRIKPLGAFLIVFGIWGIWVIGKVVWAMI
jgi:hypothetical protein